MDIKYLGHSSFKIKGKEGSVVTDPFDPKMVGLNFPRVSAEMVTVSHDHGDHNQASKVGGTSNREVPFVVDAPGEYEANGISVITVRTYHDDKKGKERGENLVSVIHLDGIIVCHLGDLGHVLDDKQINTIGSVDILLVPVGGKFTIGPSDAAKVVDQLSPSVVIPMHYKLPGMNEMFNELATVDEFIEKSGFGKVEAIDSYSVKKTSLPEEMSLVVLKV